MLKRWLYRSRQFFTALLGRVSDADIAEARQILGPALFTIFSSLPSQYKLHALDVYRRVRASGCGDRHVWQAALLHDAGKYDPAARRSITLLHRVIIVLLKAGPPSRTLLARLVAAAERGGPHGLKGYLLYPFYLSKHHPALGARRAVRHGASPEVVRLVAEHHSYRHDARSPALAALQAADERS
jgi:hypothetical protein